MSRLWHRKILIFFLSVMAPVGMAPVGMVMVRMMGMMGMMRRVAGGAWSLL